MRISPTLMLLAFLAACGLTACDSYANDPGDYEPGTNDPGDYNPGDDDPGDDDPGGDDPGDYDPEGDDPPPPVHEPPSEGNVVTNRAVTQGG